MKNTSGQNKNKKRFLCRLGFHKHGEYFEVQLSPVMWFGLAGTEAPGCRAVCKCKFCEEIYYIRLSMSMPIKYLYEESIWENL